MKAPSVEVYVVAGPHAETPDKVIGNYGRKAVASLRFDRIHGTLMDVGVVFYPEDPPSFFNRMWNDDGPTDLFERGSFRFNINSLKFSE